MAETAEARVIQIVRKSFPIFPQLGREDGTPLVEHLLKKACDEVAPSGQGKTTGRKDHPFNMRAVRDFKNCNVHHSTCIETKKAATVGLGFQTDKDFKLPEMDEMGREKKEPEKPSKAELVLNPLCEKHFQDVQTDFCEDYWSTGNGYMEVVRDGAKIVGLYHVPAPDVFVVIEGDGFNKHYEVTTDETSDKKFARFGDLDDFLTRDVGKELATGEKKVTELIHFRRPTSLSKEYGFPDWLAGTAAIELVQCLFQHTFDFFLNRGVPEFMLFLLGGTVDEKTWTSIEAAMEAHIGLQQSHKSSAFNIPGPEIKVQLEKLAMEGKTDGLFGEMMEVTGLNIVSAHRVPPLLAGIQTPGKLGATNELPNAIMAFQLLVIGQAQKDITTTLECTLGNKKHNGGLGLAPGDFNYKKITDQIDLDKADTVARMRQPAAEAKAEGRDTKQGVKK